MKNLNCKNFGKISGKNSRDSFFANLDKVNLRQKTKPNVPRPHTVHIEHSTASPEKDDDERTRTFSDSQEQDENKPPPEVFKHV